MKIIVDGNHVRVSDIAEINAINASSFRNEVRAAMPDDLESLELDLSQTRFIDGSGLGALFAIYRIARYIRESVVLQITNPRPSIQLLLELSQVHQLFEITQDTTRVR